MLELLAEELKDGRKNVPENRELSNGVRVDLEPLQLPVIFWDRSGEVAENVSETGIVFNRVEDDVCVLRSLVLPRARSHTPQDNNEALQDIDKIYWPVV